jgi:cytochrome c553
VVISPDGRRAWLPSTKVNINRGLVRDGKALTHETTVRTVVNQIDLFSSHNQQKQEVFADQIDFNDRDSAHAMAFSPAGDYAFVALQGSNNVEIVDAYSGSVRGALDNSGLAPQGVYIDEAYQRAYVYNFTSRSVSIFDIKDTLASVSFAPEKLRAVTVVGNETLSAEVLRGKQIFYNAKDTRMSRDGYMACASCHLEGLDDGIVWDFTDRGEGLRNTISLKGRMGDKHGNVHWTANFDEIHDFENDIRFGFGGTGFMADVDFEATKNPLGAPKKGKSADLDALVAYVASLEDYERSPYKTEHGKLTADAIAGEALFNSVGCASCHSGDVNGINTKRDGQRHDVGTIQANSGQGISQPLAGVGFDTPTLHGVWRTAPYFQKGQHATLEGVVGSGHGGAASLTAAEQAQLVAYVKSLDGEGKQYFRVTMRDWDECLVAEGASPDANIGRYKCGDWNDQWWTSDISGRLKAKRDPSYCAKGQSSDGGWLSLWKCNDNLDQQWLVDNYLFRVKANPNFVMDAHQGQLRQVTMYSENGQNNQFWFKDFSDFKHLQNGNGLCMTATSASQNANVVVNTCRDNDMQKWWQNKDGRFHLLRNPDLCLDYKGETNDNGALVLWECNGDLNQFFYIENGQLLPKRDRNYAVDAYGEEPGSNVGIWSVNGGVNQQWTHH